MRVLCGTKLSYMERLQLLKLDLLEIMRIKSDLKMCYRIINGLCDIDQFHYFNFAPTSYVTRGHYIKLIKPSCSTNCGLYFSQIKFSTIGILCLPILSMPVHSEFLFINSICMICLGFVGAVGLRCFP